MSRPTVCVSGVWAGVDKVWEQEKPEARKMLENAAESHLSSARFVGRLRRRRLALGRLQGRKRSSLETRIYLWRY